MEILRTVNLVKRFGGVVAVDHVSVNVEKESIVGLIGPNGSGKTTLFNVIAGVYRPDKGQVFFNGRRIDGLPPNKIYELGLVKTHQNPRLFQDMTVLGNSLLAPKKQVGERLHNAPLRWRWRGQEVKLAEKAVQVFSLLELGRVVGNRASELSGGQMKLLEMARGLMGSPELFLLDEPTAGVAPHLAKTIYGHISMLRREYGITFFIIEHRLETLLSVADKVYVMNQGRVIAEGSPDEVLRDPEVIRVYIGGGHS